MNSEDERWLTEVHHNTPDAPTTHHAKLTVVADLALQMQAEGQGIVLDQFGNRDNPRAHYRGTGPEILDQTNGRITHFVSSMGTTGELL